MRFSTRVSCLHVHAQVFRSSWWGWQQAAGMHSMQVACLHGHSKALPWASESTLCLRPGPACEHVRFKQASTLHARMLGSLEGPSVDSRCLPEG